MVVGGGGERLGTPLFASDVGQERNSGPSEFRAAGGAFYSEQDSDGIKKLDGSPLLNRENLASESHENDNLLQRGSEDVGVVHKKGDYIGVPL